MLAARAPVRAARAAAVRALHARSAAAQGALRIGDAMPDFEADSTKGRIKFSEYTKGSYVLLVSHPKDKTPVCTTELGELQRYLPQLTERNVKVLALSVDSVADHDKWVGDITETQGVGAVEYPILGDESRKVAELYGMLDQTNIEASGLPLTVRSVFIGDPAGKLRLSLTYPASVGRNFPEIMRVIDALQTGDKHGVATPANWTPGEDVIVPPTVSDADAKEKFGDFRTIKPYLRYTEDPSK